MASIPMTVLSFILAKHGLGHDMWMVEFDDITYILWVSLDASSTFLLLRGISDFLR